MTRLGQLVPKWLGLLGRPSSDPAPATVSLPEADAASPVPLAAAPDRIRQVDVAICVYGKPFNTAVTIASLLRYSGQHIGRIFLQREVQQPHGIDIAPLMKTFSGERFVHVEPARYLGIAFSNDLDLTDPDLRRSIRYQQAWEDTDKDFLFLSHNDCLYSGDVIGGMLSRIDAGPYTGVGLIGQCWNCPASYAKICGHDAFGSVQLSYDEAIAIIRQYPGPRTVEQAIDPAFPALFPECRLNEFACLIDMQKARPVTEPLGRVPPLGTLYTDIGTEWFRQMVRNGHRFLNWFDGVVHAPFSENANGFAADRDPEAYRVSEERAAACLKEYFPETYAALVNNIGLVASLA